ncbi:Ureidoglycolate lyase [compost metagenome]
MRFQVFKSGGKQGLGVVDAQGQLRGCLADEHAYPGTLETLIGQGGAALQAAGRCLLEGRAFSAEDIEVLPPLQSPSKIICIGLNYLEHAKEGGFQPPTYPAVFARFASSLVASDAPLVRPKASDQFDFEGELVVVIGKPGRHIAKEDALEHVAGYSVFNDGSVRDYQMKGAQWTVGKNFDGTGAFGPYLVTPDEVPEGAKGLRLQTRLNGAVVQDASTDDMIFDVATLISLLSEALSFQAGDVIVTGTPPGVGFTRQPALFMAAGDVCEVEIEGIGLLRNRVVDEA